MGEIGHETLLLLQGFPFWTEISDGDQQMILGMQDGDRLPSHLLIRDLAPCVRVRVKQSSASARAGLARMQRVILRNRPAIRTMERDEIIKQRFITWIGTPPTSRMPTPDWPSEPVDRHR